MRLLGDLKPPGIPAYLSIHWGWLLVGGIVEQILRSYFHLTRLSLINLAVVWGFLQTGWLVSVDRRSKAIYWYGASFLMSIVLLPRGSDWTLTFVQHRALIAIGVIWLLAQASVTLFGLFVFRRDMERYFNESEDAGLMLGPWMTLFFSTLYFQYYFHDLAERQRADALV